MCIHIVCVHVCVCAGLRMCLYLVDETFALSGLHLFWNVLSLVAHHVRDNLGVLVSNLIMTASQRTDTANICKKSKSFI